MDSAVDPVTSKAASDRRQFCTLLLASGVAALLPERAAARNRTPPWQRPVSASYRIGAGGAAIQVDFGPGHTAAGVHSLLAWVERAARAVTIYYGRFPVSRYRVRVEVVPGVSGVLGGATWGGTKRVPTFTNIQVGVGVTDGELVSDGSMTREMVYTAFPAQSKSHAWIEEGLAAYVAPVARTQAGILGPKALWTGMMRNMPRGNPQPGSMGLDHATGWKRKRWGGAQFFLLADVTIRGQTRNRLGLRDALRAIVDGGGNITTHRPLEKAFETGDRATDTTVLMEQYRRTGPKSAQVDLNGLWRELGVKLVPGSGIRFNNAAPLAAARRAITASDNGASGVDSGQSAGEVPVKGSTGHYDLDYPLRKLKHLLDPHGASYIE